LDVYTTEEQQVEEIKKWWRENGMSVVVGIALGISAIFGWRYWQNHKIERSEAASSLYTDMRVSFRNDDREKAEDLADRILADYENSAYAVFTKLSLAKLAVADNDPDSAEKHLKWALNKDIDESFSHVIRLRLLRVLISRNKLDEAGELIAIQDKGEFSASYDELLGDIKAARGDTDAARDAYQQSLNKAQAGGRDVSTLEIKIDNIGH